MASSNNSVPAVPLAFQIQPEDNVATLLQRADAGPVAIRCQGDARTIAIQEPIEAGHKLAVRRIDAGEAIVKYGVIIGIATMPIATGSWVHLHNCRSRLDERSATLDPHTGLPEDTRYE
jgi:hypothetical protein